MLVPSPGAKQEFLATVTPISTQDEDLLPFEIVLDGYTREKWAIENSDHNTSLGWKSIYLQSVDGRGKLPGFLKYLKDRKKAAIGKFENDAIVDGDDHGSSSNNNPESRKAIFVVPPDQPNPPAQTDTSLKDILFCRIILDSSKLRKKTQKPPQPKQPPPNKNVNKKPPVSTKKSTTSRLGKSKNGFLGNLLGESKKTEMHLAAVPKSSVVKNTASNSSGLSSSDEITSGTVITKFRQEMEQKLLDFQKDSATVIKIPIFIATLTEGLDMEHKSRVTMDVLKYIVYEQAEEIGEDKWVAAKEPGEFMDEAIVAIYKEGCAPAEVMEDLMKGDLPDEIKGQQRAISEASKKAMTKKEAKQDRLRQKQAIEKSANSDITQLNTNKRDRRTIAEIQRDMMSKPEYPDDDYESVKRSRTAE